MSFLLLTNGDRVLLTTGDDLLLNDGGGGGGTVLVATFRRMSAGIFAGLFRGVN